MVRKFSKMEFSIQLIVKNSIFAWKLDLSLNAINWLHPLITLNANFQVKRDVIREIVRPSCEHMENVVYSTTCCEIRVHPRF